MNPITNVREAVAAIDAFDGPASEFRLCLAESLHDPVGVNIAIVTDRILAKGWEPAGVERRTGVRVYRYKPMV
jgi:hypothetical protein